jgi:hypothetical protein
LLDGSSTPERVALSSCFASDNDRETGEWKTSTSSLFVELGMAKRAFEKGWEERRMVGVSFEIEFGSVRWWMEMLREMEREAAEEGGNVTGSRRARMGRTTETEKQAQTGT